MINLYTYVHGYYTTKNPRFVISNDDSLRGHPLKWVEVKDNTDLQFGAIQRHIGVK